MDTLTPLQRYTRRLIRLDIALYRTGERAFDNLTLSPRQRKRLHAQEVELERQRTQAWKLIHAL